jgi:hypothetical protein
MKKRLAVITSVMALFAFAGCGGKSTIYSYLLDEANVGGDPGKSIKPIKGVLVWPLENIAVGSKSKGVETIYSGILIDTLNLRSGFDRVVILEEDQAKDLMTRAGEELGLKKKPKAPIDGALISTKLGQLTNTEAILLSRLEVYDEDKVDKATMTVVSASFNLLDGREKAYPILDSFTPVKRIWRTNIKRISEETPLASRESIDEAGRAMLRDAVDQMTKDLGQGTEVSNKAIAKRVSELSAAAEKSLDAGEYDKSIAGWNEALKLQPDNPRLKQNLESAEKAKREAQEREKAAALQKQIEETTARAEEEEKAGELDKALADWKKVLELDKKNKAAAASIEPLEKRIAERKKKEAEEAEKKAKEEAERKAKEEAEKKAAAEKKAKEDAEKKAKEEAEKKAAAEKKAQEEAEKKAKEAAEAKPPAGAAPAETVPQAGEAKPAPPAAEAPKAPAPAEPATPAVEKKAEEAKPAPPAAEAPKAPMPAAAEAPKAPAPAEPAKPAVEKKAEEAKPAPPAADGELEGLRNQAMAAFNKEDYTASRDLWKKILEKAPNDKQAKEMLETTEMLLNALK